MAFLLPVPHIRTTSTPLEFLKFTSCPTTLWRLLYIHSSGTRSLSITSVYAGGLSLSGPTKSKYKSKTPREPRQQTLTPWEPDAISALNERIWRDHGKKQNRSQDSNPMDSEEANKYIQLVKEQQHRGLQKLKGAQPSNNNNVDKFSYKVDPYSLRSGDYVVHKKVGVGRFVGIKFDVPKGSSHPTEYVFIEYADGMAKLPLNQASRFLYRYSLYGTYSFYFPSLFFSLHNKQSHACLL